MISPTSITSTLNFGNANVSNNSLSVSVNSIDSTLNFGNSAVNNSALNISPSSISSTLSFGSSNINKNSLNINAGYINSTLNFGNAEISGNSMEINVNSITSTLIFGTQSIEIELTPVVVVSAPSGRTFTVRESDEDFKYIIKDPSSTLNYSFDFNSWLGENENVSLISFSLSNNLTNKGTLLLDNVATVVISGGSSLGNESITCVFTTENGYKEERTIILGMYER